jgi:hypothetical protein
MIWQRAARVKSSFFKGRIKKKGLLPQKTVYRRTNQGIYIVHGKNMKGKDDEV